LFASLADERAASGFDDSRADEKVLGAKAAVLHADDIVDEVTQLGFDTPLRPELSD
jgi:hypothetical protein